VQGFNSSPAKKKERKKKRREGRREGGRKEGRKERRQAQALGQEAFDVQGVRKGEGSGFFSLLLFGLLCVDLLTGI
jgi:hypothetical protein